LRLHFGDDANVAKWVADRIPFVGERGFGVCTAVGVVGKDGRPLAGVIWHDYMPQFKTISFSIAADSPRWITRRLARDLLSYPFERVGVVKAWTATPSSNERSLRLAKGLGFTREAVLAHHFGKDHAVILRMFLKDFVRQYGEKKIGQVITNAAAAS
jgi:RimJ/RimL family protein N-acetyltransferase